jgi:hypothetical protein
MSRLGGCVLVSFLKKSLLLKGVDFGFAFVAIVHVVLQCMLCYCGCVRRFEAAKRLMVGSYFLG